jgi:hypothetical protein
VQRHRRQQQHHHQPRSSAMQGDSGNNVVRAPPCMGAASSATSSSTNTPGAPPGASSIARNTQQRYTPPGGSHFTPSPSPPAFGETHSTGPDQVTPHDGNHLQQSGFSAPTQQPDGMSSPATVVYQPGSGLQPADLPPPGFSADPLSMSPPPMQPPLSPDVPPQAGGDPNLPQQQQQQQQQYPASEQQPGRPQLNSSRPAMLGPVLSPHPSLSAPTLNTDV